MSHFGNPLTTIIDFEPDAAECERKLASVRKEISNLVAMGKDPSQPPDQLELIHQLERSARDTWASRALTVIARLVN
jgi:hypothetical protein